MLKYKQNINFIKWVMCDLSVNSKIDFVMIWVDGNDPDWQKEKRAYDPSAKKDDDEGQHVRYRSWDNLQYWFRGVEKFAPWVNHIYFVTWGHLPEWLNTDNPKLSVINHRDYIPEKYLPTFNSHTIELNLHRIDGLSEQFVYFNDDMFVTGKVKEEDFFKNGKPLDTYSMDCVYFAKSSAGAFNGNDIEIINSNFNKNACMKKDFSKWFSPKNGFKRVTKTIALNLWPWFPGFYYNHLPSNFLKSTFETIWEKEYEVLDETCSFKFRSKLNCNQWLMKFWQLAQGVAIPRGVGIGNCYHLKDKNFDEACEAVRTGKHKLICINDTDNITDFYNKKQKIIECFDELLPDKSSFEK